MGLVRFNESSANGGNFLLYRMKPLPFPYQLYGQGVTNTASGEVNTSWRLPVVRSGASDKSFGDATSGGISLFTTSSVGGSTTTATITYTTYLASSEGVAFHLNSADTCLYVLLEAAGVWRFIKVNDSTGVVTTIGSSFTPPTVANWPSDVNLHGKMEIDPVSGHLKVTFNGFFHLINKSTGAIVSQDTAIAIGSYLAHRVYYVTVDGTVGVSTVAQAPNSSDYNRLIVPQMVNSTYGYSTGYAIPSNLTGWLGNSSIQLRSDRWFLVDNDKVCLGSPSLANDQGVHFFSRTDWDLFIKSCSDLANGVI